MLAVTVGDHGYCLRVTIVRTCLALSVHKNDICHQCYRCRKSKGQNPAHKMVGF